MRQFLCVLLALVLSPALVRAADGRVAGEVTDTGGGTLPGVWVKVHRRGLTRSAMTDAQGRFALSVPPGQYKLSAQLPGFKTVKLKVTVITGETVTPALVLHVAGYAESVTVQIRPPGPGVADRQQVAKEVRAAQR